MKQGGKIVPPVSPLVQTKLVAINPTNYQFGALITREGKNCQFLWVNRVNQTTATLFGIKVSAQFGEMSKFQRNSQLYQARSRDFGSLSKLE